MAGIKHLLSIDDITDGDLDVLFELATRYKSERRDPDAMRGMIVALLFFEPSTRTHQSFAAAAQRLGAGVIGFADPLVSSVAKGESLEDTIRVVQTFADAIVIRHPDSGTARRASAVASLPIINGGDGSNEHPTQTLYDAFTIFELFGRLDGLTIGFIGDLRYGRTVHSLARLLSRFHNNLVWIAPEIFQVPPDAEVKFSNKLAKFQRAALLDEVVDQLDVLYVSRPQKERWVHGEELGALQAITPQAIMKSKPSLAVMHALPRTDELSRELDGDPRARYFHQVGNAVPMRMAVLFRILERAS